MRQTLNFNQFATEQLMASMFNKIYNCGNYDGDDDENDDYDPDEDLHMMFDDEDYDELHES